MIANRRAFPDRCHFASAPGGSGFALIDSPDSGEGRRTQVIAGKAFITESSQPDSNVFSVEGKA